MENPQEKPEVTDSQVADVMKLAQEISNKMNDLGSKGEMKPNVYLNLLQSFVPPKMDELTLSTFMSALCIAYAQTTAQSNKRMKALIDFGVIDKHKLIMFNMALGIKPPTE